MKYHTRRKCWNERHPQVRQRDDSLGTLSLPLQNHTKRNCAASGFNVPPSSAMSCDSSLRVSILIGKFSASRRFGIIHKFESNANTQTQEEEQKRKPKSP